MITTLNCGLLTRSSLRLALVTGENCTVLWMLSLSPIGFLGSLSPTHGIPTFPVRRSTLHRDKSRNGLITYKAFANSKRLWDDAFGPAYQTTPAKLQHCRRTRINQDLAAWQGHRMRRPVPIRNAPYRARAQSVSGLFKVEAIRTGSHPSGGWLYLRFSLSYRDVEELLAERGLHADHVTVWRWVQRYASEMERCLRSRLRPTNDSWRVDETYIRVKSKWVYLYRAVDSSGATKPAGSAGRRAPLSRCL